MLNDKKITDLMDLVSQSVAVADYDKALELYVNINTVSPEFLNPAKLTSVTNSRITHIHNAANLARRSLMLSSEHIGSSARIKSAISMFIGNTPKAFESNTQQPSFFYVPSLQTNPFTKIEEVVGLGSLVQKLQRHKQSFIACAQRANEKYVHAIGEVPRSEEWSALSENWNSMHLLKGGSFTEEAHELPDDLRKIFGDELLAHCPAHAPEVVISVLQPNTKIPPHFGISNIKWTLHIPLLVSDASYLEVDGHRKYWSEETEALLFDDSFIHSAENSSEKPRAVLILDIWNPNLTLAERIDIQSFMEVYSGWSKSYGALSTLDKRLRK